MSRFYIKLTGYRMLQERPSALRLLQASFRLLQKHPYLAIPTAFSYLLKLVVILVILKPLIHVYQAKASTDWLSLLKAHGINLQGPMIYIVLILIYFLLYCLSTLAQAGTLGMIIAIFNHQSKAFRHGIKNILSCLASILGLCLINKTWGLWQRLINSFYSHNSHKNSYHWQIINLFSLSLILDKRQSLFIATQNSKSLVENNFGKNPKFSRLFVKPFLGSLLLVFLPFIISLIINTPQALWIGGALSLVLWYLFALLNSSLSLIIHAAFYELIANKRCMAGFNSDDLKSGIIDVPRRLG